MKNIFFILFIVLFLFVVKLSAQVKNEKIFPFKLFSFEQSDTVYITLSNVEQLVYGADTVCIIMDQDIIRSCVNSFFVYNSNDFGDCQSKTAGYYLTFYKNREVVQRISYCYPEQVQWCDLENYCLKATLKTEYYNSVEEMILKKKYLEQQNNVIILRFSKTGKIGIKYLYLL